MLAPEDLKACSNYKFAAKALRPYDRNTTKPSVCAYRNPMSRRSLHSRIPLVCSGSEMVTRCTGNATKSIPCPAVFADREVEKKTVI